MMRRLLGLVLLGIAVARADETWPLDNLKSIAGHDVTVVGAPRVIKVDHGSAIEFDGAHDGILMPVIPTSGAKAFTIEVLFCPESGGNEAQRFFHVQDKEGRRALLEIRTNGTDAWWLDAFLRTDMSEENKGLPLIDPKRTHPTNQWYWVAMRYDGKRLADFVNGVKELEGEGDFSALGDGKISIGVRQNLVYWFKGAIREVRFHTEALPEEKMQGRAHL